MVNVTVEVFFGFDGSGSIHLMIVTITTPEDLNFLVTSAALFDVVMNIASGYIFKTSSFDVEMMILCLAVCSISISVASNGGSCRLVSTIIDLSFDTFSFVCRLLP